MALSRPGQGWRVWEISRVHPGATKKSELCSNLCSGDRFWPFYNFQFFGGCEFSLPWKVVVASVGHRTDGKLPYVRISK